MSWTIGDHRLYYHECFTKEPYFISDTIEEAKRGLKRAEDTSNMEASPERGRGRREQSHSRKALYFSSDGKTNLFIFSSAIFILIAIPPVDL